jgi:hypothetical protein
MTSKQKAKTEVAQQNRNVDNDNQLRLEDELAATFPASDPPSITQPGIRAGTPERSDAPVGPKETRSAGSDGGRRSRRRGFP